MEAPRGVEVSAAKGPLKVSGRKDLQLESTEGEVRKLKVRSGQLRFCSLICLDPQAVVIYLDFMSRVNVWDGTNVLVAFLTVSLLVVNGTLWSFLVNKQNLYHIISYQNAPKRESLRSNKQAASTTTDSGPRQTASNHFRLPEQLNVNSSLFTLWSAIYSQTQDGSWNWKISYIYIYGYKITIIK